MIEMNIQTLKIKVTNAYLVRAGDIVLTRQSLLENNYLHSQAFT